MWPCFICKHWNEKLCNCLRYKTDSFKSWLCTIEWTGWKNGQNSETWAKESWTKQAQITTSHWKIHLWQVWSSPQHRSSWVEYSGAFFQAPAQSSNHKVPKQHCSIYKSNKSTTSNRGAKPLPELQPTQRLQAGAKARGRTASSYSRGPEKWDMVLHHFDTIALFSPFSHENTYQIKEETIARFTSKWRPIFIRIF